MCPSVNRKPVLGRQPTHVLPLPCAAGRAGPPRISLGLKHEAGSGVCRSQLFGRFFLMLSPKQFED